MQGPISAGRKLLNWRAGLYDRCMAKLGYVPLDKPYSAVELKAIGFTVAAFSAQEWA